MRLDVSVHVELHLHAHVPSAIIYHVVHLSPRYGAWFGVHGLVQAGQRCDAPSITKAVEFLLAHQNTNGGWGEDFSSCYDLDYAQHGAARYGTAGSSVVQTSWALLALLEAECQDEEALRRGVAFLAARQRANGDWAQEGIAGVFNRSCGISYTQYRPALAHLTRTSCKVAQDSVVGLPSQRLLPLSGNHTESSCTTRT